MSLMQKPSVLVAIAALAALTPLHAEAAFTQNTCYGFGWNTAIPVAIGATEYVKQTTLPLAGPGDMTLYNVNTAPPSIDVVMNTNVHYLQPWYGYFVSEFCCDKLQIWGATDPNGHVPTYSGSLNTSTTPAVASSYWQITLDTSLPTFSYTWNSDYSITGYAPPSLAQLQPWCRWPESSVAPNNVALTANTRTDIILIDTGDTVYTHVLQPANTTMVVSTTALATGMGDFDLYASTTTATPDDSSYQWRGYTSTANEAFTIPPNASARWIYIGVHSYASGGGHVALTANVVTPVTTTLCFSAADLVTRVNLSYSDKAILKDNLQGGTAYLYGYSNGMVFRNQYNLNTTWTTACDKAHGCDVCVVDDAGTVSYGNPGSNCGFVEAHGGNWRQGAPLGWLFAHESGHSCFGLADQYVLPPAADQSPRTCGHTTMANNSKAVAYCSKSHCSDGSVSGPPCTAGQSDWTLLEGSTYGGIYPGPKFGANNVTSYGTPYWQNTSLKNLVGFGF